jgi:hypothetical protein
MDRRRYDVTDSKSWQGGAITTLDDDLTAYIAGELCIVPNLATGITVNPIVRFVN